MPGAERTRVEGFGKLENGLRQASEWYLWGPYLSERQWGTVREDYSADGDAWSYLPHDHARSRAYRWGEDGMAGFSDVEQQLCLALALWNGRDPILKERMFGLTGVQANHGEDVKEYWWYLDAVPSHSWNRWRYHYPQSAFPYDDLIAENGRRGKLDPEYELLDTGAFDEDRYWIVEVHYAKANPSDLLMTVQITNAGPDTETLHVLPTAWFRNTWSWDVDAARPRLWLRDDAAIAIDHPFLGDLELLAGPGPDGTAPTALFCENETNDARLYGSEHSAPYPKDGINDHVVAGSATVNPERHGTKAALWYQVAVEPGATAELRLRLRPSGSKPAKRTNALGARFDEVVALCRQEADEFYAEMAPAQGTAETAMIMRQAFSGMLWSKQLYAYDVRRWLEGDPTQPTPPADRWAKRNSRWKSFDAFDIMSMPDKWEYPWFAAWDMAFHCVALAHVDPAFAKYQLVLLCREWFQHPNGALPAYEWDFSDVNPPVQAWAALHPNGALPAYEWDFSDVNPPVQAWAALEVWAIDGARDLEFLSRIFDKLLVNFTWWMNLEDTNGTDLFEGGFLGLDNIGPLDRSHLPVGGVLEQSDATGWMGFYALAMAGIAGILSRSGERAANDLVLKFLEHFATIRQALATLGLWDEEEGLYCDSLVAPDGTVVPVKVRSMVGIIPLLAAVVLDESMVGRAQTLGKGAAHLIEDLGGRKGLIDQGLLRGEPGEERLLLGVVGVERLLRLFEKLFDEREFLSRHGLRALSAYHREHPYVIEVEGITATVDYEPAESTTDMFGGNSNWRGPIWFPLNYLVVSTLDRYYRFFGDELTIEYPTGTGQLRSLDQVGEDLRRRLVGLFERGPDGLRPCFGGVERLQRDPAWRDNLVFSEYFHGDNGAGLGASHQTGWTGVVADLIRGRPGNGVYTLGDAARLVEQPTSS